MAAEYKTLGQTLASGGISTYTTLYEVPTATSAVVSNLHICNLTGSEQTVRIACSATVTPSNEEFLAYNLKVDANESYPLVIGITMRNSGVNPTKYLMVSSSSGSVSFAAFGAGAVMTARRLSDYGVRKSSFKVYTEASPTGQDIGDMRIYGGTVGFWDGTKWVESGDSSFSFFMSVI